MKQKFISGIYNYCDRWCERCTFTSQCRNYDSTNKLTTEQLDITNEAFWESISSNFQEAIGLMHEAAEKHGFDLDAPMTEEEETNMKTRELLLQTAIKQHPLSRLNKQYQKIAMPFVKESEGLVDKNRELISHLHLGIITEQDVVYTVADIGECFEVIQWYLFFIDAKLQRALHGKKEDEENSEFSKDSDGSAKVALTAIERSMQAWSKLYYLMPSSEDTALKMLSLLEQMRRKANEEFAQAMSFQRPGFDD